MLAEKDLPKQNY